MKPGIATTSMKNMISMLTITIALKMLPTKPSDSVTGCRRED